MLPMLWSAISNVPVIRIFRRSATGCAIPRATATSTAMPLIETVREDGTRSICLCPYVPFVRATAGGIGCAVSGGPFTVVAPHALHPTGSVLGDFCAWGHCGACGNGIVRFCAEVPLWEYREPEPLYDDFTTERWRKIRLHKRPGTSGRRPLPGRLHFVPDGGGISNVSF